ncbi:hypothetical protein OUZ56_012438 [Daphnia magna]|uniref:Uncharacterized protein n=1 Tax=Daphnia magna TaxID=35525 RepID=A0ABQ9Z342_9CRUS|nr:hypothetical protein OUZ56_012438 [Daphnia magna]
MKFPNLFTFCHPKNQLEKYTPPYGTARGDPTLMEGTALGLAIPKPDQKWIALTKSYRFLQNF